nr:putative clathrin assembly protein At5g35200 isoform X1 [Tanacetum cinerariifolium]GEY14981.1 putative clathrin assembly protein At5g35200 isoform X1 [Tanacetum cinerariifolium]
MKAPTSTPGNKSTENVKKEYTESDIERKEKVVDVKEDVERKRNIKVKGKEKVDDFEKESEKNERNTNQSFSIIDNRPPSLLREYKPILMNLQSLLHNNKQRKASVPIIYVQRTRELDTPELFGQLSPLQQFLYSVLGCGPQGALVYNFVIQLAFTMAISEGTQTSVDKFFEMKRYDATIAMDMDERVVMQVML